MRSNELDFTLIGLDQSSGYNIAPFIHELMDSVQDLTLITIYQNAWISPAAIAYSKFLIAYSNLAVVCRKHLQQRVQLKPSLRLRWDALKGSCHFLRSFILVLCALLSTIAAFGRLTHPFISLLFMSGWEHLGQVGNKTADFDDEAP